MPRRRASRLRLRHNKRPRHANRLRLRHNKRPRRANRVRLRHNKRPQRVNRLHLRNAKRLRPVNRLRLRNAKRSRPQENSGLSRLLASRLLLRRTPFLRRRRTKRKRSRRNKLTVPHENLDPGGDVDVIVERWEQLSQPGGGGAMRDCLSTIYVIYRRAGTTWKWGSRCWRSVTRGAAC